VNKLLTGMAITKNGMRKVDMMNLVKKVAKTGNGEKMNLANSMSMANMMIGYMMMISPIKILTKMMTMILKKKKTLWIMGLR